MLESGRLGKLSALRRGLVLSGLLLLSTPLLAGGAFAKDPLWQFTVEHASGTEYSDGYAAGLLGTTLIVAGDKAYGGGTGFFLQQLNTRAKTAADRDAGSGMTFFPSFPWGGYTHLLASDKSNVFLGGKLAATEGGPNNAFVWGQYFTKTSTGALWDYKALDLGGDDYVTAMATTAGQLLVAYKNGAGTWQVNAYNAATGVQSWQDDTTQPGQSNWKYVRAAAADTSRFYVAGVVDLGGGNLNWQVKAYAPPTGAQIWQKTYDYEKYSDEPLAIASNGTIVVVAGYGTDASGDKKAADVAYNAATGEVLGSEAFGDPGKDAVNKAIFMSKKWSGNVAEMEDPFGTFWRVKVYSHKDGTLLWTSDISYSPDDMALSGAATDGKKVFLCGTSTHSGDGARRWLVWALDAKTGGLLWNDIWPGGSGQNNAARSLVLGKGVVYVSGSSQNSFGQPALTVRAYSTK